MEERQREGEGGERISIRGKGVAILPLRDEHGKSQSKPTPQSYHLLSSLELADHEPHKQRRSVEPSAGGHSQTQDLRA